MFYGRYNLQPEAVCSTFLSVISLHFLVYEGIDGWINKKSRWVLFFLNQAYFNIFVETHCMRLETAARKENVDTTERRMQCVSTFNL